MLSHFPALLRLGSSRKARTFLRFCHTVALLPPFSQNGLLWHRGVGAGGFLLRFCEPIGILRVRYSESGGYKYVLFLGRNLAWRRAE